MGRGVLLNADNAREVLDFVAQRKGRPQNELPQSRRWPIGDVGTIVQIVRSTSAAANANGYSPGFTQIWSSTTKVWTDGVACQILDLVGLTVSPGRYLALNVASTADGTPTYLAVDVLDVEYDDSTGLVPLVYGLILKKLDFVLANSGGNTATVATRGLTNNTLPRLTSVT